VGLAGSALPALAVALLALAPPGAGAGAPGAYAVLLGVGTGARLGLPGTPGRRPRHPGPALGRTDGALQAVGALGGARGPLLAGFLREAFGPYPVPFLLAGLGYLPSGRAVPPRSGKGGKLPPSSACAGGAGGSCKAAGRWEARPPRSAPRCTSRLAWACLRCDRVA